jgi:hypothetical protein
MKDVTKMLGKLQESVIRFKTKQTVHMTIRPEMKSNITDRWTAWRSTWTLV